MMYIYYIVGIQTPIRVPNGQAQIGQSALQVTLQLNLPTYQVTGVVAAVLQEVYAFKQLCENNYKVKWNNPEDS